MNAEQAIATARRRDPSAETFVVRLYDGFDGEWMDVTGPLSPEEAKAEWAKRTDDGKRSTGYFDVDYYAIYPTSVKMVWSEEGLGSHTRGRDE